MKYLLVIGDGMADNPVAALGGRTPLEIANKPFMDKLAKTAEIGMCRTVADGLKPGSDVANLSVMGYDPKICYTGRSPLEAASIGVDLKETDVALRCNIVTLSDEENYEDKTMVDYCSGDISSAEAAEIIKTVIIHNLEELAILGVVIVIRALLAFIIHWEMRIEEKGDAVKITDNRNNDK
jgi:2,3-bisphosphoglycerate-independent phosphoglycerate mutase